MIASAGLATLSVVGVQTAHAQFLSTGTDKPWYVSGTLRGFYDDNYNTQPDGPFKVDSFGFEVRPGISLNLPLDQTTLSLSYVYDLKYYDARETGKTDQSHDIELFLNHQFSPRYSLDFANSFVIAQEPEVIDRSLSLPTRSNGDNFRNSATFNFHAELTELLGLVLGYSNSYFDYSEDAGDIAGTPTTLPSRSAVLDRLEQAVPITTRWNVQPETTLLAGYIFSSVSYLSDESIGVQPVNSTNFVAADIRNNYSHYGFVGVEHHLRSDFFITARGGAIYTAYYNNNTTNATESIVSPYAELSGTYTYMDGGNLTLGFRHSRNATDVSVVTATSGVTLDQASSTLFGTITQRITPKLTGTLSGQFQNSTFNGGEFDGDTDTFYLFGANLAYQITHYLSAEVGYNYDKLDSEIPGRSFDRNRVYVGITASY